MYMNPTKPTREEIRLALRERWPSLPIAKSPLRDRIEAAEAEVAELSSKVKKARR
jgi:hypothetical protein